jgi:hypothetical protein
MTIHDSPAAWPVEAPSDAVDATRLFPGDVFIALLLALVHPPVAWPAQPAERPAERPRGNPHALAFWL